MRWRGWFLASALLTLPASTLACGAATSPLAPTTTPAARPVSSVLPRGDRLLGIDVSQAAGETFDQAFRVARDAGLQFASLSVAWDDLEPRPGEYAADPNWLAIANSFYAAERVPLALTIATIDTNRIRLPEDLHGRSFDDPEVIARFGRLLDYVFTQIPDVDLAVLAIGNEVDATLGADEGMWQAYRVFFEAAAAHARASRPAIPVGVKMTLGGLTGDSREQAQKVNALADLVLVTYYPLESDFDVRPPQVVHDDLAGLVALYPGRPIGVLEIGYPSSEVLGSSEALQAEFVRQVFQAWDDHAAEIVLLNFTWLTDASDEAVDGWKNYYGLRDDHFAAYLASLGLRRSDGTPKAALEALASEAHARGW